MLKRPAIAILLTFLTMAATLFTRPGGALAEEQRLSGPFVHENLAVYLIHGQSSPGPAPLTLAEALAKGSVKVIETGQVNELAVENMGDEDVFIQGGDIVKGGRQDRVLAVSLLLSPKSGRVPISAFCVEAGRWSARGKENAAAFSAADSLLPSREAKLALKAVPAAEAPAEPRTATTGQRVDGRRMEPAARQAPSTASTQSEVWRRVGEVQDKLAANLGGTMKAKESETSLQLTLENEKLAASQQAFVTALEGEGAKADDVVGYVFAINGRINSGDVYASNALFRKLWPRVLKAAATEAIGHKDAVPKALDPSLKSVQTFLDEAAKGDAVERALPASLAVETRSTKLAVQTEMRRKGGDVIHRNLLAK